VSPAARRDEADRPETPSAEEISAFRERVRAYYEEHGRSMPWRETHDPYAILVSEVMLQQTQVSRVVPAYESFLDSFPDAAALGAAPLEVVLREWQGLGYNRRAVRLKQAAERLVDEHDGHVPCDFDSLLALPGVGPTTAAGIMAFAWGEAYPYIETNVRAALLHDFVPQEDDVPDSRLVPIFEVTVDREDPRTWLYALMDYGAHLKATMPNPSRRSRHYARQSPFEGSRRQKRSKLLKAAMQGAQSPEELAEAAGIELAEADELLDELTAEGFLAREGGRVVIA
jgi:A/G-specific adenine glycosylase